MVWVDYEVGEHVHTGRPAFRAQKRNPCGFAYEVFCRKQEGWCEDRGRASWDPIAVLYAARGPQHHFHLEAGRNTLCKPSMVSNPGCKNNPTDREALYNGHNSWHPGKTFRGPWRNEAAWRAQGGEDQARAAASSPRTSPLPLSGLLWTSLDFSAYCARQHS